MTEELKPELAPIEEKMTQELVKANVTEAVISTLREKYLPLKIAGLDDKETYLLVKEGRKECKSLRVMAKKICTNGREEATAIQKAWIAKEKEVTSRIAEVEDYLEVQEKEYEAGIAAEKEARRRKQEEQLILRQQTLTEMGAMYSEGNFILGDVSFELSAIKESESDIWNETIYPAFEGEYKKIQAEEIEKARLQQEREAELKREQEELEQKKKELALEAVRLKEEADRQADEKRKAREAKQNARIDQLFSMGLKADFSDNYYKGYGVLVAFLDIQTYDDEKWNAMIAGAANVINIVKEEEAEEKRKEQERKDIQDKRYAELLPFDKFGDPVAMDRLWDFPKDAYLGVLEGKKAAFQKAEEERNKQIAEAAAKKERERIEEEQRQAEVKRIKGLREFRVEALAQYGMFYDLATGKGDLGEMSDDSWWELINEAKSYFEEAKRKQEEERKAEELAKAGDKEKWNEIMERVEAIEVYAMRSSQYRKKAAILREKLEEIKAL